MGRLPFGYKLFLFLPLPARRRLKLLSFLSAEEGWWWRRKNVSTGEASSFQLTTGEKSTFSYSSSHRERKRFSQESARGRSALVFMLNEWIIKPTFLVFSFLFYYFLLRRKKKKKPMRSRTWQRSKHLTWQIALLFSPALPFFLFSVPMKTLGKELAPRRMLCVTLFFYNFYTPPHNVWSQSKGGENRSPFFFIFKNIWKLFCKSMMCIFDRVNIIRETGLWCCVILIYFS